MNGLRAISRVRGSWWYCMGSETWELCPHCGGYGYIYWYPYVSCDHCDGGFIWRHKNMPLVKVEKEARS